MLVKHKNFYKRWIKDLRSGKYSQCYGKLASYTHNQETFCALGVATYFTNKNGKFGDGCLDFMGNQLYDNVAAWNDYDRLSFEQIADKLEVWLAENERI